MERENIIKDAKPKNWENYDQDFSSISESRTHFMNKSLENESVVTSPLKSNRSQHFKNDNFNLNQF